MEASYLTRHPLLKDALNLGLFVVLVIIGTILINTFIFRSYNVVGPSMESTLFTGDRLLVNRMPVTWAHIKGKSYLPERGQVIVFENPQVSTGGNVENKYIVKRVIGLPGERVVLKDGKFTVYNTEHPDGFNPDELTKDVTAPETTGEADVIVPEKEIFVSGDHREGTFSYDSRNGLGTIPLYDVIGPASLRIFPLTKVRGF
ncbi:signal peptidase I [Candidatus Saccharibacteria bacterium TM7i]|nr:signal peptidase I [Candidatus Saccharibacteria bacterium TM7i]